MKYEKGTFITVPNIQRLQELPPTAQALFMWLCSYADKDGQCYPSRTVLAKNLHCAVRSVDAHLAHLIEAGFIEKHNRVQGNEKQSNLYQIMLVGSAKSARGSADFARGGSAESAPPSAKNSTTPRAKSAHRTKPVLTKPSELNTKATALVGEQWNLLIDGFAPVNPMYTDFYRITTERNALQDLADRLGFDKLLATINHLEEITSQPYAPKITKPTELKRDIGKLIAFYKQKQRNNAVVEI
jgi:hypothetical protein